jgi:CBS-domain-containing membrane protein
MTEDLETVTSETDSSDALSLMVSRHIRHLPVVDKNGDLAGLLSIRNLLQYHVEELVDQLNSLEAYHAADGPGG